MEAVFNSCGRSSWVPSPVRGLLRAFKGWGGLLSVVEGFEGDGGLAGVLYPFLVRAFLRPMECFFNVEGEERARLEPLVTEIQSPHLVA